MDHDVTDHTAEAVNADRAARSYTRRAARYHRRASSRRRLADLLEKAGGVGPVQQSAPRYWRKMADSDERYAADNDRWAAQQRDRARRYRAMDQQRRASWQESHGPVPDGPADRYGNKILAGDEVQVIAYDPARGATSAACSAEVARVVKVGRTRVEVEHYDWTGFGPLHARVVGVLLEVRRAGDGRQLRGHLADLHT